MQPFPKRIFVTGIGTGVGKTLCSAVLVEALKADYWKPIQCGNLEDSDSIHVKDLITNSATQIFPEAYRLRTPSSPHYAARVEGVTIDIEKFVLPQTSNALIIEGAGGLMVPLNEEQCVVDLISTLHAPVVLVCRNYLGSINHALLSIHLLKQKGISLLGIIFSGDNFLDNEEIIQHFSQIPVIGNIAEAVQVDSAFVTSQAAKLRESISKYYTL